MKMVRFLPKTSTEDEGEDCKVQYSDELKKEDTLDTSLPEFEDFSASFADSFLDFDSIKDWIEGNSSEPSVMADLTRELGGDGLERSEVTCAEGVQEIGKQIKVDDDSFGGDSTELVSLSCHVPSKVQFDGLETVTDLDMTSFSEKGQSLGGDKIFTIGDFGSSIENGMEKVCFNGVCSTPGEVTICQKIAKNSGDYLVVNGVDIVEAPEKAVESGDVLKDVNFTVRKSVNEEVISCGNTVSTKCESDGESETSSESSSLSSSSSSSASSSDENEEVEEISEMRSIRQRVNKVCKVKPVTKEEADMEEGEIGASDIDEMVSWSDAEIDEDGDSKGPIRSKNEAKVLPPVPAVDVSLQPHHLMSPVGVVSSIIGAQVIVEGIEKHNPLNEGSILWVTESRSPLGIVDEIFGPVKNPYYIVRYNSEGEVPTGIHSGTSISFVPEFANHVLNDCSLYKKGYDASGENDEELSEEAEFSDDEKEAEYRRMQKMKKRGVDEQKVGKKKDNRKFKGHVAISKSDKPAGQGKLPNDQCQPLVPSNSSNFDHVNNVSFSGIGQNVSSMPAFPSNSSNFGHGNNVSSSGIGQGLSSTPAFPSFPQLAQTSNFGAPPGFWPNGVLPQQPQGMVMPNILPTLGLPWQLQNQPQQLYQMPFAGGVAFHQQINTNSGLPTNFNMSSGQPNPVSGSSFAAWPACIGQNVLPVNPGELTIQPGGQQAINPTKLEPFNAISGNDVNTNTNQGSYSRGGRQGHRRGGGRFGGGRGRRHHN